MPDPLAIRLMPFSPKLLLRGRGSNGSFVEAVAAAAGLAPPLTPGSSIGEAPALLWLSPTGWLLVGWPDELAEVAGAMEERLQDRDGTVIDVSDEYEHLEISGEAAPDLMATCSPLDLSLAAFPAGSVARTLMAGVPAIIWRRSPAPTLDAFVDRSWIDYLVGALEAQALEFR